MDLRVIGMHRSVWNETASMFLGRLSMGRLCSWDCTMYFMTRAKVKMQLAECTSLIDTWCKD